jgi:carboxyl-terminal processing protease
MKARVLLLAVALGMALGGASAKPTVAPATLEQSEAQAQAAMWATRFLTRFHYKRVPLDDAMSGEILERYVESLDGDRLFFLAADVEQFQRHRATLDDAIYDKDLEPPFELFRTYVARVGERTRHARGLLATGFDFTVDEVLELEREEAPWATSAAELDELWRKRVKNDWLRLRLNGKKDEEIRKTLDKRYRSFQERVAELDAQDVFQTFMNAYASAIEPHTGYLGPRASENFAIQMRLSLEGIGAVLGKDDDYTVVRTVVKGGPAYGTGRIKVGDRIVGVAQGDKAPLQDVIGWRLDDVVDLIRGPKGTTVVLDVIPVDAPADSKPVHVAITRDTVKLEEQAAKKSVIEIDDDVGVRRIGVIALPTFYHDFDGHRRGDADFRSSTRDVARLLDELKDERVEGVVIDLRGNGGGSLTEATNLTGLFIDKGPVVQVRDAQGRVSLESDTEAGVAWDGPLAVLVDRASASASEIFAAALQDYGRALVIGEPTYGKGTVQNLVDLDDMAQNEKPRFGQLKLTIAQFFRVNGGSTQNRGVLPDVEFPSVLDPEQFGESALENALPWTSITPAAYDGRGDFRELVPLLEAKHEARVARDREFQYLVDDIAHARKLRQQSSISLLESARRAEREKLEQKSKARKAEREALAALPASIRAISFGAEAEEGGDQLTLDDGLQADERPIAGDAAGDDVDASNDRFDDARLGEASRVLLDAIDLLASDSHLAAKVKAFNLAENTPRVN